MIFFMINKHLKFIGHFFGRKRRNANALEIKHGFMGGGGKILKKQ